MFGLFKRKPVEMETVDLQHLRDEIYNGFRANAPCTRRHMSLFAAAASSGAAAFRFYHNLSQRLIPLIDEAGCAEVQIPANSKDYYGAIESALRRVLKG